MKNDDNSLKDVENNVEGNDSSYATSHKAESSMFDQLKPFLEGLVHVIGTFKLSFHVNLKKSDHI